MKNLCLFLLCGLLGAANFTVRAQGGTIGNTALTWSIANGTLTIGGTGAMPGNYSSNQYPWYGSRTTITRVVIGSGVTAIGSYAFYNCTSLTEVRMEDATGELAFGTSTNAFSGCPVETLYMGRNVTHAVSSASTFGDMTSLNTVTLGSNVDRLGTRLFGGCTRLSTVTIEGTKALNIGQHVFSECTSLTNEVVNNILTKAGTAVNDYTFGGCTALTALTIPANITSINAGAFKGCASLTEVRIADATGELAFGTSTNAFSGCPVETLYMGRNVTHTVSSASTFGDMTSLRTVTLGSNVDRLGTRLFGGCTHLTTVVNRCTTPQSINAGVFAGVDVSACKLEVPCASLSQYQAAAVWQDFNIQCMGELPAQQYTITFDAQGGTVTPPSMTVTRNEPIGTLPLPLRSGYVFEGWTTYQDGSDGWVNENTIYDIEYDITLYAQWTASGGVVTSVTVSPSATGVQTGTTQRFTAEVAVTGGTSTGVTWSVAGNASNATTIGADGRLTVAADETATVLIVTATSSLDPAKKGSATVTVTVAAPRQYTITFDAQGGTVTPSSMTVTYNEPIGPTPAPVRTGYIFEGWALNRDASEGWIDENTVYNIEYDYTLYAQWTAITVTSVTVSPSAPNVQKGRTQQFTAGVTVTDDVSTGVTWSVSGNTSSSTTISADGLLTVADDEKVTALTVIATSVLDPEKTGSAFVTVTETATATRYYTIVFDAQGGSVNPLSKTVTYNKPIGNMPVPVRNGFFFEGWAVQPDGSGIIDGSMTYDVDSDIILYARWTAAAAVTAVTVSPATANVRKGTTQRFTADVTVTGGASAEVTWSVSGNASSSTKIGADGLLTVAAGETATALTVMATSVFDPARTGTATITVTSTPIDPSVTSVVISPAAPTVPKGQTQRFTASVITAGGASAEVTWAVSGNTSGATAINADGLLTVAADETAATLTVIAISVFDNTKAGTASATVTEEQGTASIKSVSVKPGTATVRKGTTQQFTVSVAANGDASTKVIWAVSGNTSNATVINAIGLLFGTRSILTVAADETATTLTVTATSEFDPTRKGTAVITLDGVTGAPELEAPDLKVYPNPFAGTVHLTGAEGGTLRIVNVAGVTVHTQNIESPDLLLPLEHLPAGVYFFRMEKDGRAKTVKVIKQ